MQIHSALGFRHADRLSGVKLSGARILIIENDLAALQAMEALLGQWGCELRLASSAREAMSALSSESAWTPEIIVADQHLHNGERGTSVSAHPPPTDRTSGTGRDRYRRPVRALVEDGRSGAAGSHAKASKTCPATGSANASANPLI